MTVIRGCLKSPPVILTCCQGCEPVVQTCWLRLICWCFFLAPHSSTKYVLLEGKRADAIVFFLSDRREGKVKITSCRNLCFGQDQLQVVKNWRVKGDQDNKIMIKSSHYYCSTGLLTQQRSQREKYALPKWGFLLRMKSFIAVPFHSEALFLPYLFVCLSSFLIRCVTLYMLSHSLYLKFLSWKWRQTPSSTECGDQDSLQCAWHMPGQTGKAQWMVYLGEFLN